MLAAGAFGGTLVWSSPLGEGPRGLAPSDRVPPCAALPCDAAATSFVDRIEAQLGARMSQMEDLERRDLARTIATEAERAGIDALLVLAVIEVESSFDPAARSRRGARGLMQLRGPTMRREAARSRLAHDDPRDPFVNVQAGVRYLRRLLDAFRREEVALMAYNAGPNRIRAYMRAGEIPSRFRHYPRRVEAERRRLRRSLGMEPAPLVADAAARWVAAAE